jgi:hypothetical protein
MAALYFVFIVCCVKLAFFYDNYLEISNTDDLVFIPWKKRLQASSIISTYFPLITLFFIETRINSTLRLPDNARRV